MPYVSSKKLLLDARENHYAVGAFNVENMEMMLAVLAAAEAERSPVILQTTPSTLKYAPTNVFAAMARAMAEKASVPVACTWITATALNFAGSPSGMTIPL